MVLNTHHAELQSVYDTIPNYWEVCNAEKSHHIDVTQLAYFTLAVLLIAFFGMMLASVIPSTLFIIIMALASKTL
jgi:hypothetical protein